MDRHAAMLCPADHKDREALLAVLRSLARRFAVLIPEASVPEHSGPPASIHYFSSPDLELAEPIHSRS